MTSCPGWTSKNQIVKTATPAKEALYIAFPFAFTKPTVDVEVPLGRMTVERDQQPGAAAIGTATRIGCGCTKDRRPSFGVARHAALYPERRVPRRVASDDRTRWTLFAYAMNNYWQHELRGLAGRRDDIPVQTLRSSHPGMPPSRCDALGACEPLYVSPAYSNDTPGPLIGQRSRAVLRRQKRADRGSKPADDGEGVIVKVLDVAGQARSVGYGRRRTRSNSRAALRSSSLNGDAIAVGGDGRASVDLAAWVSPPPGSLHLRRVLTELAAERCSTPG